MNRSTPYSAEAISDDNENICDVRITVDDKKWHLWGRNGFTREADMAATIPGNTLPVLFGTGLGHCLQSLIDRGDPIAVVDMEEEINRVTGVKKACANAKNVLWVDLPTPQKALEQLTKWQASNGGKPFSPLIFPLYPRLNRAYYGTLAETLKSNAKADFWTQARYPKFQSTSPRILFFDSNYFLCGEILASLTRLGIEHATIQLDKSGVGSLVFVETLLKSVVDFRPDFVLTVNHFGMDREGKLAGLLSKLGLPLASWFVDNPHLILHQYEHPGTDNTAIFTYDAGNLDQLRDKGFANTHYLPLATDPERFRPSLGTNPPQQWKADVSFVGNSMSGPVAKSLKDSSLPEPWEEEYRQVAAEYGASGISSVMNFLVESRPDWQAILDGLPTRENRLALESLLTWEATRQYRLSCVEQIIEFAPLIVGDNGWIDQLGSSNDWRHIPGIDYYKDLPSFYAMSKINFNCTSRQMVGAVNQRVFDAPACGGFVLTDYREQMEDLFDLENEVVVYTTPEEIPDLIREYLADDKKRKQIAHAARERILAEHTYEIRLEKLISLMRSSFS